MSFVDFETTKELTVIVSVNNTKIGTGETCGGFDSSLYNLFSLFIDKRLLMFAL